MDSFIGQPKFAGKTCMKLRGRNQSRDLETSVNQDRIICGLFVGYSRLFADYLLDYLSDYLRLFVGLFVGYL